MSGFVVHACGKEDISAFMSFLRAKWNDSHIMANSRSFVDYFFYDEKRCMYNILYALDNRSNEIEGFIAFTTTSFFDPEIAPGDDFCWITNWLATEKAKGAGLLLLMKLRSFLKCKKIGVVGQNRAAEAIYSKMKFKTGNLFQYFMLNEKSQCDAPKSGSPFFKLESIDIKKIEKFNGSLPKKTAVYIENKYLKSPFYKYYAYGVSEAGALKGAIIFKVQDYPKEHELRCLRIVEYFGDYMALVGKKKEIQLLLDEFGARYIDFYCSGIPEDVLFGAGFDKNEGQVLLPNYFEPFLGKNIEIRYAYEFYGEAEEIQGFTVFKGDGDREHPRTLAASEQGI